LVLSTTGRKAVLSGSNAARALSKVRSVLHWTNAKLVEEVYLYLKSNSVYERHNIIL